MQRLASVLRVLSVGFLAVAGLHVILGVRADVALGADLPMGAVENATLDSQNRFYGVAFSLYGVLLYVCAANVARYADVLRCVFWAFFAGGLARVVSIALLGMPSPLVMALLAMELIAPPVLHTWLSRTVRVAGVVGSP